MGMSETLDRPGIILLLVQECISQNIPAQQPVILLCDGHSSHYTPEVIAEAATHGVYYFVSPPIPHTCLSLSM